MGAEAGLLSVTVTMLVEIVESALADPDDTRMLRALDQPGRADVGMLVRLVRMDPDGRPYVRLTFGGRQHGIPFALACRDVEHRFDAARPRAR